MRTRVVVTGMGAVTPIGNDVESFWQGLKDKKVGIGPISYFDTTDFKCKLAAEVKDFDPKAYMDPKAARRMERFSQLAVAASKQALEQSGLDMSKEDPYRVGVCVGSGIGSLQTYKVGGQGVSQPGHHGQRSGAGIYHHRDDRRVKRQRKGCCHRADPHEAFWLHRGHCRSSGVFSFR